MPAASPRRCRSTHGLGHLRPRRPAGPRRGAVPHRRRLGRGAVADVARPAGRGGGLRRLSLDPGDGGGGDAAPAAHDPRAERRARPRQPHASPRAWPRWPAAPGPPACPRASTAFHVGNPVRAAVLERQGAPYIAPGDYPMSLLVIGGSQGARILSDVVPEAVARCPRGCAATSASPTRPAPRTAAACRKPTPAPASTPRCARSSTTSPPAWPRRSW